MTNKKSSLFISNLKFFANVRRNILAELTNKETFFTSYGNFANFKIKDAFYLTGLYHAYRSNLSITVLRSRLKRSGSSIIGKWPTPDMMTTSTP